MFATIFKVLFIGGLVTLVVSVFASVALNIDISFLPFINVLQGFFRISFYLLPMSYLKPLFIIIGAMFAFRTVVAIIKTIWDLLPIV